MKIPQSVVLSISLGIIGGLLVKTLWNFSIKPKGCIKESSGDQVLYYNKGQKILAVLWLSISILIIGIVMSGYGSVGITTLIQLFAFALFATLTPALLFSIVVFGTFYRITKDGIVKHRPLLKDIAIDWVEVKRIGTNRFKDAFIVQATDKKIVIPFSLNGLLSFTEAVRSNVPNELWGDLERYQKS